MIDKRIEQNHRVQQLLNIEDYEIVKKYHLLVKQQKQIKTQPVETIFLMLALVAEISMLCQSKIT